MKKIAKDLERWFKERPAWLQDVARRLIQNGKLSDKDYSELVKICKKETGITVGTEDAPEPVGIPDGALQKEEHSHHLQLLSISNVIGINALHPRKPLLFGDGNLTIVYGTNGSGKSGYVRALKHACGAKYAGPLYPDIYASPQPASQGCRFTYKIDGASKELNWTIKDGVNPELASIELYDSACADIYINEENELTYEPGVLSLFALLTGICDKVGSVLDQEITSLVSCKQIIPTELSGTPSEAWYSKLNFETSKKDIDDHCMWSPEDQEKLDEIITRMSTGDPKTKAAGLRKLKDHTEKFISILKKHSDALAPEHCNKYLDLRNNALLRRKTATEDAGKVFSSAPLTGVGTESWKAMWEKARYYSEKDAYKGIVFPNTDKNARCVLCQNVLDEDAKTRLITFEDFIKGALEKDARFAEEQFVALKNSIEKIPSEDDLALRLDSSGLAGEKERESVLTLREALEYRLKTLEQAEYGTKFDEIPGLEIIKMLEGQSEQYEKQAQIYDEDSKADKRLERNLSMILRHPTSEFSVEPAHSRALASVY